MKDSERNIPNPSFTTQKGENSPKEKDRKTAQEGVPSI